MKWQWRNPAVSTPISPTQFRAVSQSILPLKLDCGRAFPIGSPCEKQKRRIRRSRNEAPSTAVARQQPRMEHKKCSLGWSGTSRVTNTRGCCSGRLDRRRQWLLRSTIDTESAFESAKKKSQCTKLQTRGRNCCLGPVRDASSDCKETHHVFQRSWCSGFEMLHCVKVDARRRSQQKRGHSIVCSCMSSCPRHGEDVRCPTWGYKSHHCTGNWLQALFLTDQSLQGQRLFKLKMR